MKEFFWFLIESKKFMGFSWYRLIKQGGIRKAIEHSKFMAKWKKMNEQERLDWYINENRVIEM